VCGAVSTNNALAFPGIFRGALDAGARQITEKMVAAPVVSDDLALYGEAVAFAADTFV